uniref:Large exoprotein n=1 Tax=Neobacillus citreus TaxID=2833578 RepID=A0A942SX50_9BACI
MAGIGSWGGGIVLLVAAVLWLVYLMPSWAARRQYLATERNAIRLQQTLRILAQTAELPEEVRVEMNAKSLAEAQRVAKSEEAKRTAIVRAHEAARQREITRRLAEQAPVLERASSVPALTAMRMRRSRLGATTFGALGLVTAVVVFVVAPAAWLVGVAGLVAAGGSAAVLAQLHQVAQARKARAAAAAPDVRRASRPTTEWTDPAPPLSTERPAEAPQDRSWTPNRVPKPLYVERPAAPRSSPESSAELAARLKERVAAAKAEAEAEAAAIRAAEDDPSLARVSRMRPDVEEAAASLSAHDQGRLAERLGLRAPAEASAPAASGRDAEPVRAAEPEAPSAPPSRWAGMGVIDEGTYEQADLDAIMRRRRAV